MRGLTPAVASILSARGEPDTRGGMGRRGLGHPRPAARGWRAPAPRAPHRARTAGRLAVVHAVALLGGMSDLPDRARPGRARRVRHPRAPAGREPADARVV